MKDTRAIVPSELSDWTEVKRSDDTLKLGRTTQGKLYEKHILTKGTMFHPATGKPLEIDDEFVNSLVHNFDDKVCDIVQVPIAGDRNQHTEDPTRNIGEVVGIKERDGKVYAVIDARDNKYANKLGKTLLGASAMLSTDYINTKTGKRSGPTLLHVCVTNRPYLTDLEDYKEIVAASADSPDDDALVYVVSEEPEISEETETDSTIEASAPEIEETVEMTLDELIATLKSDHNIDVRALQASASQADAVAALSHDLSATVAQALANTGVVELSNPVDQVTAEDLIGGIADLAKLTREQSDRVHQLELTNAQSEVDRLVENGYVLPTQRDAFVELRLSNESMFTRMVPDKPVVAFSHEVGVDPRADEERHEATSEAEVERYVKMYKKSAKASK